MENLNRIIQYLLYLIRSIHLHGIHSPFVFQIHQDLIKESIPFYIFDEIESVRAKLLLSDKAIKVRDLGASGKGDVLIEKKIKKIAKTSLKSPRDAQLLFRLVYQFKPSTILELGTSMGITTSYLAKANPKAKIISIEGSNSISKIAALNQSKLNIENIKLIVGDFKDHLPNAIQELKKLDFVFFDGNHQKEATLNYFEHCLTAAHEESIFVFDDIYWSKEMQEAWSAIKANPKVSISLDLYNMGIVFFKSNQAKEHFTIYH